MPFCTQCGARLENGAKYCTSCGAKQPEPSATVYVPPTEERPAEPRTYSYTPPASAGAGQPGGYTYDPTIYSANDGAANKARGKKGGTVVFLILAALVVIAALIFIFLSVKGGTSVSDDSVLGLYSAQKAESSGFSISIESMWKDGFTIELKEKGKAEINVDGQKGSAKWTLDGNAFSIKGSGIDCAGTLSNGVLTLENVMGTEITLYFSKDGALIPSAEWEAPHPVPGTDPPGQRARSGDDRSGRRASRPLHCRKSRGLWRRDRDIRHVGEGLFDRTERERKLRSVRQREQRPGKMDSKRNGHQRRNPRIEDGRHLLGRRPDL